MELTHRTQTSLQAELDPRSQAQKDAASTIYSALYDWQTRVILLHPAANFSEPLVAQLRTVELLHGAGVVLATGKRRRIGYTALSYCWGPPEFEKEIELYGKMYPITQNLYDALLHLRNERTPVTLWIDALCINQWDAEERSLQIFNMMTIFSKASEVIAWIGVGSSTTAEVMKDLREPRVYTEASLQSGLSEIFQNELFRRVWIKQEVFAAVKLFLQCGKDKLPWETLWDRHTGHPARVEFVRRSLAIRFQIEEGEEQNFYLQEGYSKQTDIINVLRSTSNSHASDPRDFVYGVVGMSRTILRRDFGRTRDVVSLPVDYKRSVAQVFGDVARYIMGRDGCLNVLLLTCNFGGTIDGHELPSWIPNWRIYTSPYPWLSYATSKSGSFDWKFNEYTGCADEESPFVEQGNDMVLCVQGLVLGHIKAAECEHLQSVRYVWQLNDFERTAEKILDRDLTKKLDRYYPLAFSHFRDLVDHELLKLAEDHPTDWPKKGLPLKIPIFGENESNGADSSFTVVIPAKRVSLRRCLLYIAGSSELYDNSFNVSGAPNLRETKIIEISVGNVQSKRPLGQPMERAIELHDEDMPDQPHESSFRKQTTQQISHMGRSGLWPFLEVRPENLVPPHWAVPLKAEINDVVVLLKGGILPMVFRPVPEDSCYRLVGPAALTQWAWTDAEGILRKRINHYLWTNREDQYLFLLRLLDLHQTNGTLEKFHLI